MNIRKYQRLNILAAHFLRSRLFRTGHMPVVVMLMTIDVIFLEYNGRRAYGDSVTGQTVISRSDNKYRAACFLNYY